MMNKYILLATYFREHKFDKVEKLSGDEQKIIYGRTLMEGA